MDDTENTKQPEKVKEGIDQVEFNAGNYVGNIIFSDSDGATVGVTGGNEGERIKYRVKTGTPLQTMVDDFATFDANKQASFKIPEKDLADYRLQNGGKVQIDVMPATYMFDKYVRNSEWLPDAAPGRN